MNADTQPMFNAGVPVYSVEELFDADKAEQHDEKVIKLSDLSYEQKRLLGITEVETEVIVQVKGGLVTGACSNNPNLTMTVIDYDNVSQGDDLDERADKLAEEATDKFTPGKYKTCY